MKVAITGKGGVGKTTFAACLARLYADEGRKVLCADVDPDANLGLALGFTEDDLAKITPITEMKTLIKQRTEADQFETFFKINPKVDDLPDMLAQEVNGVKLLLMGTVKTGGAGCVCPEHVILKRLLSHLIVQRDDVVIMDMEAGLEHLGRGTAGCMDSFVVVVEPGERSLQTWRKVKQLAADLGVKNVRVVANKVRGEEDEAFIRDRVPADELLGMIHYDRDVIEADRQGASPYDLCPAAVAEIRAIRARMENE